MQRSFRVNQPSVHLERSRLAIAGEAADAAWRAWRYPVGNRTAAARDAAEPSFAAMPQDERERHAETAWEEVMRRDRTSSGPW